MSTVKRRIPIPLAIILICCVGSATLAFGISWVITAFDKKPPLLIPSSPEKAVEILGIDTKNGFYVADPIIRTVNGTVYKYTWKGSQYSWQLSSTPGETSDTSCGTKGVKRIEAAAGNIIACREVQPSGEFVVANLMS